MSGSNATQVLNIFDDIIDRVKQAHPVRTDGKPLGGGVVYSRLILGMPVDPADYIHPWAPFGTPGDGNDGRSAAAPAAAAAPDRSRLASDAAYRSPYVSAYHTAALATMLLQVTDKETYLEYPVGKNLAVNYESIIASMQPGPMPAMAPDVRARIDAAQRVLFAVDANGNVQPDQKTPEYDGYLKAVRKYQKARSAFATAQAAAAANPALAQAFPITSAPLREDIDDAFQALQALDPSKVEQALDVLGSVGISMQDHMIAKARELFENYQVSLTELGDKTPYSYILPTGWCDPDDDDEGWESLSYTYSDVQHFQSSGAQSGGQSSSSSDHTHTDASVHGGFAFWSVSGQAAVTNDSAQWQGTSYSRDNSAFKNTAKNLTISLEYMLATIYRPWLVADLFYLANWYTVGNKKNAISNGMIAGQVETSGPILPMLPQQMLVVRNVTIHADDWGDDGQVLDSFYNGSSGDTSSSSTSFSGGGGVSFGPVNFGGNVNHDQEKQGRADANWQTKSASSHFGTTFESNTLSIPGAQIMAFLSDIVPASAPLDDPGLATATPKAAA